MLGLIRYERNRFYDGKTVCIPTPLRFPRLSPLCIYRFPD